MSTPAMIGKLIVVIAIFMVVFGLAIVVENLRMSLRGRRTVGKVVGWNKATETDSDGASVDYYHPVIEFRVSGEAFEFESENRFGERRWKNGTSLPVLYNPSDPNKAQLLAGRWTKAIACLSVGLAILAFILTLRFPA